MAPEDMTTDTKEKLFEAMYFLKQMKEMQYDQDAFKYNLSAFLAASRSVTLIMQSEFDKTPGFKEWYSKKQVEMKSDETMRLLNEKRVMTIHRQPIRPRAHIKVNITEHVAISESISIIVRHADGTIEKRESEPAPSPTPAKTEVIVEWRWYFDELPEMEVVIVSEEHAVKLESLVTECESLFT